MKKSTSNKITKLVNNSGTKWLKLMEWLVILSILYYADRVTQLLDVYVIIRGLVRLIYFVTLYFYTLQVSYFILDILLNIKWLKLFISTNPSTRQSVLLIVIIFTLMLLFNSIISIEIAILSAIQ